MLDGLGCSRIGVERGRCARVYYGVDGQAEVCGRDDDVAMMMAFLGQKS